MTIKPINGAIRFLLELGAITTYGIWGFNQSDSWFRILLAILLPMGFAILWGVFAVRNDPSRSGKTVVQTLGWIRLLMELGLFTGASWMLQDLEYILLTWIFGGVVLIHYIISYKRIAWLLKQK
jgi:hypothetical protein